MLYVFLFSRVIVSLLMSREWFFAHPRAPYLRLVYFRSTCEFKKKGLISLYFFAKYNRQKICNAGLKDPLKRARLLIVQCRGDASRKGRLCTAPLLLFRSRRTPVRARSLSVRPHVAALGDSWQARGPAPTRNDLNQENPCGWTKAHPYGGGLLPPLYPIVCLQEAACHFIKSLTLPRRLRK